MSEQPTATRRTAQEVWDEGLSASDYVAQMTQNRDLFQMRIETSEFDEAHLTPFRAQALRLLFLTEDFCGDSAQFLPPLVKLGQILPDIEVRFLLRDQYQDVASAYVRPDGYQAIPVVIVMDADGHELGHIVERPQRVYDALAAETRRFVLDHPELEGANRAYQNMPAETKQAVFAHSLEVRQRHQAEWAGWMLEDVAAIVVGATAGAA